LTTECRASGTNGAKRRLRAILVPKLRFVLVGNVISGPVARGSGSGYPGRKRSPVLGGTNRQGVEHPLAQPPAVGVTDVGDPAADSGVDLGEAYLALVIGVQRR
jgi:hypothetical protein